MRANPARLAQIFTAVGQFYVPLFTAFYFVVVLALETEWRLPYSELIGLWTLGSLLVGAGALPAGWFADRIGALPLMSLFFLGMGGAAIGCAFATTPLALMIGLAFIGLFAAIYHPVGIVWLVRNSTQTGRALGLNGIFGSAGVSGAGIITGAIIDLAGWRAAFLIPGLICAATGIAFVVAARRGLLADTVVAPTRKAATATRGEMRRGFVVLIFTMFCGGLVFQVLQAGMPKVFAERLGDIAGQGTTGVGALVAAVYAVGGVVQYFGGQLADRYPARRLYIGAYLLQVPAVLIMAGLAGLPLAAAAMVAVTLSGGLLPAENMMLTRFTPERHRALAFGLKYVVAFGTAPLALQLLAWLTGTGAGTSAGFTSVFLLLGAVAGAAFLAALALPGERAAAAAVPATSAAE